MRACWGANTSKRYAGDGRHWFEPYSPAASSATFSAWEIDPATRDQSRRKFMAQGRSCSQAVSCFDWLAPRTLGNTVDDVWSDANEQPAASQSHPTNPPQGG